jgi:hypothetical protein
MSCLPPRVTRTRATLSAAIGVLVLSSGAAHADPVALTNPGFEDADLGPWATYGALHEVTRDAPHQGARALRLGLSGTGTAAEEAGAYQDVALEDSGATATNVRVMAAVVVDTALAGDATASVVLEVYKKINGTLIAEGSTTAFATPAEVGDWATFEACAIAPAGYEVFVRPSVTLSSASGKGTGAVRLDDVALTAGDDAVCAAPAVAEDGGCTGGALAGWGGVLAALAALARRRFGP